MIRARFSKTGNAIWISHLDLMRVLQRSFRRAGLLLKHSQGFTPHPALSLALPLSVGVSSICEIMDFELEQEQDVEIPALADRLNAVLPEGIHILETYESGAKVRELTHLRAEIRMEYDNGIPDNCKDALEALFSRNEILMEKKTKSGAIAVQNIREMILQLSVSQLDSSALCISCVVCAQNPSLNPAMLAAAAAKYLPEFAPDFSSVRRLEVLTAEGTPFR